MGFPKALEQSRITRNGQRITHNIQEHGTHLIGLENQHQQTRKADRREHHDAVLRGGGALLRITRGGILSGRLFIAFGRHVFGTAGRVLTQAAAGGR